MSFSIWVEATRPKTLPAAVAPVLIGSVMAYVDGAGNLLVALACLLFSLLVQIGTNFANDYYDFEKGTDDEERIGPRRACAAGLVEPETMHNAMIGVFGAAALVGVGLLAQGGWIIALVVAASIWAGWAYTAGPYPLGYNGLGDLFVLIFFGPVAVGTSYYLQALEMQADVLVVGLAPGLISTAILAVNNLRDMEGDKKSGKRTLAVRFGVLFGRLEYIACLVLAALIPPLTALYFGGNGFSLLTLLVIPFAVPVMRVVVNRRDGPTLNKALADTGQLLVAFTMAFAVGRLIG